MIRNMFGNKRNLLIIVAIFVGVTIYFLARRGGSTYSFNVSDGVLSVKGGNDYAYSVSMTDIASTELTKNLNIGTEISGATDRNHICGIYENDSFGRYDLWVIKKVKTYVVLTDNSGHIFVVNFESDRSTEELYKALNNYIDSN